MNFIQQVFDFVWASSGVALAKQIWMAVLSILWQWIAWLFDPSALVSSGLRVFRAFLAWAEGHVPGAVGTQLDAFNSFLGGAWFHKLLSVALWFGDQVTYTPVVVLLYGSLFGFVLVVWCARSVIWVLHQLWGVE